MSTHALQSLKAEINEFFGHKLLIGGLNDTGRSRSRARKALVAIHPLHRWWRQLNSEITPGLADDDIAISRTTAQLIELYTVLRHISPMANSRRILDRINNASTFHSAAFEGLLAAIYDNKGYRVEITDEGRHQGKKACDLIVHVPGGPVYVEAKSLRDPSIEQHNALRGFGREVLKMLASLHRACSVTIYPIKIFTRADLDTILSAIALSCGNKEILVVPGVCRLEIKQIAEWDRWMPLPFIHHGYDDGWEAAMEAEVYIEDDASGWFRKGRSVSIDTNQGSNVTQRICNQLKKAARKAPSNECSIVHVELPHAKADQVAEIMDAAYESVCEKLNKDHRRINAVHISAQLWIPQYQTGESSAFKYEHCLVPNSNARKELPSEFEVICAAAHIFDEPPGETGTFACVIDMQEPYDKSRGKDVAWHCSRDGKRQFRLRTKYDGHLRAEIVCPEYGRRVCDAKMDRKMAYGRHIIWVKWDQRGMVIKIDRRE